MRSAKEILSGIPTPFRAGGGGASSPAESRRNRERKHHSTGKEHLTRPFALSGDVLSSIFSAGDELAKYTSKSAEEVEGEDIAEVCEQETLHIGDDLGNLFAPINVEEDETAFDTVSLASSSSSRPGSLLTTNFAATLSAREKIQRPLQTPDLATKVGDVLSLIDSTLSGVGSSRTFGAAENNYHEGAGPGQRLSPGLLDDDHFSPEHIFREERNKERENKEELMREARQNFYVQMEEIAARADEALKRINHDPAAAAASAATAPGGQSSSAFFSKSSMLDVKSFFQNEDDEGDDDEEDEDGEERAITFGDPEEREKFEEMTKEVEVLTSKLHGDDRLKSVSQVSKWFTNRTKRLIIDTKHFESIENEAQAVSLDFDGSMQDVVGDIDKVKEEHGVVLSKFHENLHELGGKSKENALRKLQEWREKMEEDERNKTSKRDTLRMQLARLRAETSMIEEKLQESDARKLNRIEEINHKYEGRTKHLMDLIEEQQSNIAKLQHDISDSETHLMQLELEREELVAKKEMDSRDKIMQQKMAEADQKKKKLRQRKILRQQREKREEAERRKTLAMQGAAAEVPEETEEMKQAKERNAELHAQHAKRQEEIDELEAAINDVKHPKEREKFLLADFKALEKELERLQSGVRQAESNLATTKASKQSAEISKLSSALKTMHKDADRLASEKTKIVRDLETRRKESTELRKQLRSGR